MNIMKKTLKLLLICSFMLITMTINMPDKLVLAEDAVPKYLDYKEAQGIFGQPVVYKDKAIVSVYNAESYKKDILYYDKGDERVIPGSYAYSIAEDKAVIEDSDKYGEFSILDLNNGAYIDSYNYDSEVKNLVTSEYGKEDPSKVEYVEQKAINNSMWYQYLAVVNKVNLCVGVVSPTKKLIRIDDTGLLGPIFSIKYEDKLLVATMEYSNNTRVAHVIEIDEEGNKKDNIVNLNGHSHDGISGIYKKGNDVYLKFYKYTGQFDSEYSFIYKLNMNDGKLDLGNEIFEGLNLHLTQDNSGNFWSVNNGFVSKFQGDKWLKKYEVDNHMNQLSVYDESNLAVTGTWCDQSRHVFYKLIYNPNAQKDEDIPIKEIDTQPIQPLEPQNPTTPSTPSTGSGQDNDGTTNNGNTGSNSGNPSNGSETNGQNPSIPTNGSTTTTPEKVVVSPVKDGVLPIAVNKLDKNAENVVEAVSASNASKLEVTIADTKAIKEGTGSIQVKVGQNSLINLPFSVIDKSLLTDTAKVVLSTSAESNTDLVKGLKAVKKLYSFDISVVDGDKKTAVHKFANGTAEITLALSDEELKGLDKNNLAVFYYNEDTKKFELMETKVEGNKITFKTPHFSKFIIAEKTANTTEMLPKTGSSFNSMIIFVIGSILVLLGITALRSKKLININN